MANNGKYAKPSASLTPVLLRVAFVLLCLLMVSMYLMGGLLAKYTANGSGGDSARVAKFDVDVTFSDGNGTISDITADLKYGENGKYTITVVNKSEVAVHYDLSVTITADDTTGVSHRFSAESGDLAVGATSTSDLIFTVDWKDFTENKKGASASVELSFVVTVNVTQID